MTLDNLRDLLIQYLSRNVGFFELSLKEDEIPSLKVILTNDAVLIINIVVKKKTKYDFDDCSNIIREIALTVF